MIRSACLSIRLRRTNDSRWQSLVSYDRAVLATLARLCREMAEAGDGD